MPYLNLDLDYFEHRKTRRLIGLLGRGAEVLPLRLWSYCGKFHCEDGRLTDYSEQEIESLASWWGEPGKMLPAMLTTRFMGRDSIGWFIASWLEHQGHIASFKLKGKAMAEARWGKAKIDADSIAHSNANAPPLVMPEPNEPSQPNQPDQAISNRAPDDPKLNGKGKSLVDLLSLCRQVLGEKEMKQWHKRWYERADKEPDKLRRVLAEVKGMVLEKKVKTTPAKTAEDLWGRWN